MADTFLTVDQIAVLLQINPETVRRWLRDGKLRGTRLEGNAGYRVSQRDLDEFMRRRETVAE